MYFTFAKDGKLKKDLSETREVIFMKGPPFRKLVARNGKPLPAKEQAEIQKVIGETHFDIEQSGHWTRFADRPCGVGPTA